jgi:hypothetical protein
MSEEIIYPIPPTRKGYNVVVLDIATETRIYAWLGYTDGHDLLALDPHTMLMIETDTCTVYRGGDPRPILRFPHALITKQGRPNHPKVRQFIQKVLSL